MDLRHAEFRSHHAKCVTAEQVEDRDPQVGVVPGGSGVREDNGMMGFSRFR